jgi:hypothetical protein
VVRRYINNIIIVFIIFCSTSFYQLSILGPLQKVSELAGIGSMLLLMILHFVYTSERVSVNRYFAWPVLLIFVSAFLSMFSAYIFHEQDFSVTLLAQRALYFYLFYFLLHQLKPELEDLETIFIMLGILYIFLYLIQFILYPKIIYDAFITESRGTIRIYMAGANYMAAAFFIYVQSFLRTIKFKYLIFSLVIFSFFILNGGRQTVVIMSFVFILFLILDKRVKSRFFLAFLGMIGAFALFMLFRDIFAALVMQSQSDVSVGEEYIRIRAARYYLTEFNNNPWLYIAGNGAYGTGSNYGKQIEYNALIHQFFIGDIGIIGNYVLYGALFVFGVLTICLRSLTLKIESRYDYIKYMFIAIILSLLTGGVFSHADFIVFICCVLYIIDISASNRIKKETVVINNHLPLNHQ